MNEEQKWAEMFAPLAREGGEGAPENAERTLVSAFRARRAARRVRRLLGAGLALAAAVILAVSVWKTPAPVAVESAKIAQSPTPLPAVAAEPVPVKTSRRRVRPVPRREEEMVFYSIPNAGVDEPIERGEVVRVSLPREAVGMFGIPVNPERMQEIVQADVVLGEDGTARAVRFVR